MTLIDKGIRCGTHVVFAVEIKNDGSFHGDIRVLDNPKRSMQMASPMEGTLRSGGTEADVICMLETALAKLVQEAQ